ncbi:hypothetical protein DFQ28_008302 [Apophysomyces sp. BC1034]|nr:hypothetical protein DFQ30_007160 [Apophysomyces sp. BC1015]KAG0181910.1 hypothetical protein DFQ29_006576 [Apophysomyces sp. BC1021]KAG0192679.1 hypothetical protein DFQ28_008302 [Apophysomyces sp. BC1034]
MSTNPTIESKKEMMNNVDFQQLFQSLAPQPDPVFDEWLNTDFSSAESVHSSPEITTPLDVFLASPPFHTKDDIPQCAEMTGRPIDLDMSEILQSPIPAPSSMDPLVLPTPEQLFAEMGQVFPAALAAFAAANTTGAPPASPVTPPAKSAAAMSPITSASTPVFSASPRSPAGQKRSSEAMDENNPMDEAAIKRQKNTDAARRSRLKKVMKMEGLEKRVSDLEKTNANLLLRVAVLDSEKSNLKAKESSYENRIQVLEAQLAEAHKALASRT